MTTPETPGSREEAIRAMLPYVAADGWTDRALRRGLKDLGRDPEIARDLFPGGSIGLVSAWRELLDRDMERAMRSDPNDGMTKRVRALIALRLGLLRPHREAARRALAVLAHLGAGVEATQLLARTADAIWHAAGDSTSDFSWYTKRASLGAIYAMTLLYWLHHESEDDEESLAFLDRRLGTIATLGRLRGRLRRKRSGRARSRAR